MAAFYNEIEPYAADWLENLITAGHIAPGVVDRRSIVDIEPADLAGFTQVHLFAGIGGWSLAARLADWSDDRQLWTGSCPCQPYSVAGAGKGQADERHLWPEMFRLIAGCRPAVVMGEQVAAAVGKSWLDGVFVDLESINYTGQAAVVPACAVNAPHRRDRLWFVADRNEQRGERGRSVSGAGRLAESANGCRDVADGGMQQRQIAGTVACAELDARRWEQDPGAIAGRGGCCHVANGTNSSGTDKRIDDGSSGQHVGSFTRTGSRSNVGDSAAGNSSTSSGDAEETRFCQYDHVGNRDGEGSQVLPSQSGVARSEQPAAVGTGRRGAWDDCEWITGYDGKSRRVKSGVRLLAHGISGRVGQLRALGNAIVPQVAAEIIGAYLDTERTAPAPLLVPPLPY